MLCWLRPQAGCYIVEIRELNPLLFRFKMQIFLNYENKICKKSHFQCDQTWE